MDLPNPLSHAYLITGGSGDSRAALIKRMAAAYLCRGERPPCGRCVPCRKVLADIHPDVSHTGPAPGKQEIAVDQIRALRADAYIRPNEGLRKVYVIDPADAILELVWAQTCYNAALQVGTNVIPQSLMDYMK